MPAVNVPGLPGCQDGAAFLSQDSTKWLPLPGADRALAEFSSASTHMAPTKPLHNRLLVFLFALTVFCSAFLLFQVQPLISRFILPWFGGSPAVWSTCMLFFQVTLFGGYVYAHVVSTRLAPRWQAILHVGLLLAAAALLPIAPADSWKPDSPDHPTLRIIGLLSVCVGLPYFILSSTGPLLQKWFSLKAPGVSPYRLYALSNVGSLLALVSYPFVVEPALSSPSQANVWSWGFVAFAVLCAICAFGLLKLGKVAEVSSETSGPSTNEPAPSWGDRAMWVALAMVASVMLLATTNQVCLDVATVPFLWILPLTIYLMSFILCFDGDRWYSRHWYVALLVISLLAVIQTLLGGSNVSIVLQVMIYLSALFFCCMVCHGELSRQKPGTKHLTQFYLLLSAGGAGGGLFVGLIAPHVFPAYWELHIGIAACLVATLAVFFRDKASFLHGGQPRPAWLVIGLWVSLIVWSLQSHARQAVGSAIEVSRNFYGVLRVEDDLSGESNEQRRGLFHGSILHGTQFLDSEKEMTPTAYYSRQSGVGLLLQQHRPERPRRIGVVGLGIGTLAAYGTDNDVMRFYEINPEVLRLAERHFTFLSGTDASTEHVLGDARLSLEHESPQQYDVLVLDAFSGDAIPTHLLTREAGELYAKHVRDDGFLAVHISNLHFDLRPVVKGLADHLEMHSVCIQGDKDDAQGATLCHWMLMSRAPIPQDVVDAADHVDDLDELVAAPILWTDEWSNLISVLR